MQIIYFDIIIILEHICYLFSRNNFNMVNYFKVKYLENEEVDDRLAVIRCLLLTYLILN